MRLWRTASDRDLSRRDDRRHDRVRRRALAPRLPHQQARDVADRSGQPRGVSRQRARLQPDLMVVVYNDHMNRFFFDAYPSFALGAADKYPQADEGWGARDFPDFPGHAAFSWHLAQSLVEDEFDPTICQEMSVDHGILSILPLLTETHWPAPIVPIAANVIQHPIPTPRRFFRLGEGIRRAIESYPEDLRVLVVSTGGMSHQLHGPRFGFLNPDWDNEFMDRLESDPISLTRLTHAQYME